MNRKQTFLIILSICILGFILRLVYIQLQDCIDQDSIGYMIMAKHIANGNIAEAVKIRPEMPFLYPYTLGILSRISGFSVELLGWSINMILGVGIIVLGYFFAKLIFNKKVAITASLFCAVTPLIVSSSGSLMRDTMGLFLIVLTLYLAALTLLKNSWYKWAFAGFFGACSAMTRPDGIETLVVIPIWIIVYCCVLRKKEKNINIRNLILGFLLFLIIFLVFAIPYEKYFHKYGSSYTIFLNEKLLDNYVL